MCVTMCTHANRMAHYCVLWLVLVCSDEDDTSELLQELQRIKRERAEEQVKKVCCRSLCHCVVYDGCVMSLLGRSEGGEKQRRCVVGGSVSGEDDNVLTTAMKPTFNAKWTTFESVLLKEAKVSMENEASVCIISVHYWYGADCCTGCYWLV